MANLERQNLEDERTASEMLGPPMPPTPPPQLGIGDYLISQASKSMPLPAAALGGLGEGLGLQATNPDLLRAMAEHPNLSGAAATPAASLGQAVQGLGIAAPQIAEAGPLLSAAGTLTGNPLLSGAGTAATTFGKTLAPEGISPYSPGALGSSAAPPAVPAKPTPSAPPPPDPQKDAAAPTGGTAPAGVRPQTASPTPVAPGAQVEPELLSEEQLRNRNVGRTLGDKANASEQAARDLAEGNKKDQDALDAALARHQQMVEDIYSTKIDPNRYYSSLKGADKVWAGVGRAFTAIGNGLTGDKALSGVDQAIQGDIVSQQSAIDSKKAGMAGQESLIGELMKRGATRREGTAAATQAAYNYYADKIEAFKNPSAAEVASQVRVRGQQRAMDLLKGQAGIEKEKAEAEEKRGAAAENYAKAAKARAEAKVAGSPQMINIGGLDAPVGHLKPEQVDKVEQAVTANQAVNEALDKLDELADKNPTELRLSMLNTEKRRLLGVDDVALNYSRAQGNTRQTPEPIIERLAKAAEPGVFTGPGGFKEVLADLRAKANAGTDNVLKVYRMPTLTQARAIQAERQRRAASVIPQTPIR